ncbi:MAG: UDP-glucose/GDP-mannose dehydrogenase family protein, partial [Acidimicrobiia bacterium]|nr:UDP-glucose/GDP-mannose dehydrogenase family protein [Acidimicrobiia bacterium]
FAKVEAAAGGDVRGSRIAVWGLAFKAGTDDVRESPALAIVDRLVKAGADVVAFDPQATVPGLQTAPDAMTAVDAADVLLIATEWPQFQRCDLQVVAARMRGSAVVDARNLLDPIAVKAVGLTYTGVGR